MIDWVSRQRQLGCEWKQRGSGNGAGKGGTCNGDSGGPVFLGHYSSNLIVGVTSFGIGNLLCRETDLAYRIDQPEVLAWIEGFQQ